MTLLNTIASSGGASDHTLLSNLDYTESGHIGFQPTIGYMHVRDEKSTTTNGGTSVTGINIRELNTVVSNSISGASLATNQITLPAGTYRFYGSAPQFGGYKHHALLYNVTDATYAIIGEHGYNEVYSTMRSHVAGKLIISATKVFELRHWIEYGRANGLGLGNTSSGYINVFASLEVFKEA